MRGASAVTTALFAVAFTVVAIAVDPVWIVAALGALALTFLLQTWS